MHQPSLSPPRRCGATTVAMPAHGPTAWSEITTEYEDEYHYGEQLAAGKGHVTEQQRKGKQLGSFVLLDARTPAQKEETQAKLRALPPRNADACNVDVIIRDERTLKLCRPFTPVDAGVLPPHGQPCFNTAAILSAGVSVMSSQMSMLHDQVAPKDAPLLIDAVTKNTANEGMLLVKDQACKDIMNNPADAALRLLREDRGGCVPPSHPPGVKTDPYRVTQRTPT